MMSFPPMATGKLSQALDAVRAGQTLTRVFTDPLLLPRSTTTTAVVSTPENTDTESAWRTSATNSSRKR